MNTCAELKVSWESVRASVWVWEILKASKYSSSIKESIHDGLRGSLPQMRLECRDM